MSQVTIYKRASDASNGFIRNIDFCLQRIKDGKSKDIVEWLRTLSNEDYQKNKSKLPGVCFNGVFDYRSIAGLKEHSGFIILDFDKFESQQEPLRSVNLNNPMGDRIPHLERPVLPCLHYAAVLAAAGIKP